MKNIWNGRVKIDSIGIMSSKDTNELFLQQSEYHGICIAGVNSMQETTISWSCREAKLFGRLTTDEPRRE